MASSLWMGQQVVVGQNRWEVLDFDDLELRVRVHSVDVHFARHLKSGCDYQAYRHLGDEAEEQVWEIVPEQLKDASRRVLMCVTESRLPTLELSDE